MAEGEGEYPNRTVITNVVSGREMAFELSRADRYHKRAEELRVMAESTLKEEAKKALLDAADTFDQLAENTKHPGLLSSLFRDL